jgi:cell division protein FtsQ
MVKAVKKKPRTKRVHRRDRLLWVSRAGQVVLCFGLVIGLTYGFYRYLQVSPHFLVRSLEIRGAELLPDERVRAVAAITAADNVIFLNTNEVQRRLMQLPHVYACSVRRRFPDTIIIEIEERVPVATLLLNNHLLELDNEGMVLRELDPAAEHTGPFITDVSGLGYVEVGQQLEHPALLKALEVYEAFSALPIATEITVSEIAATAANAILMYCNELPFEIRWGRRPVAEQARDLHILWRARKEDLRLCKEYLDLRFDNQLACK